MIDRAEFGAVRAYVPTLYATMKSQRAWFDQRKATGLRDGFVAGLDAVPIRERRTRFGWREAEPEAEAPRAIMRMVQLYGEAALRADQDDRRRVRELRRRLERGSLSDLLDYEPADPLERQTVRELLCEAVRSCGPECAGEVDAAPPAQAPRAPRYALRWARLRCADQQASDLSWDGDEVMGAWVTVDGTGAVKTGSSMVYDMSDEPPTNVRDMANILYPPADPEGYLAWSLALWEIDDGAARKAIADAFRLVAETVGKVEKSVYGQVAAGVLGVAGILVGLTGDGKQLLGERNGVWVGQGQLESAAGTRFLRTFSAQGRFPETDSRYHATLVLDRVAGS